MRLHPINPVITNAYANAIKWYKPFSATQSRNSIIFYVGRHMNHNRFIHPCTDPIAVFVILFMRKFIHPLPVNRKYKDLMRNQQELIKD